jgi:hypothetical protein
LDLVISFYHMWSGKRLISVVSSFDLCYTSIDRERKGFPSLVFIY